MCFHRKIREKRDLPRICMYCTQATAVKLDPAHVFCSRKGVVGREYFCRRFSYDPLKHVPSQTPHITPANPEDIKIIEELLAPTKKMVQTGEFARVGAYTGEFTRVGAKTGEFSRVGSKTGEFAKVKTATGEIPRVLPDTNTVETDLGSAPAKTGEFTKIPAPEAGTDATLSDAGNETESKNEQEGIPSDVLSDALRESVEALGGDDGEEQHAEHKNSSDT